MLESREMIFWATKNDAPFEKRATWKYLILDFHMVNRHWISEQLRSIFKLQQQEIC